MRTVSETSGTILNLNLKFKHTNTRITGLSEEEKRKGLRKYLKRL